MVKKRNCITNHHLPFEEKDEYAPTLVEPKLSNNGNSFNTDSCRTGKEKKLLKFELEIP